MITIEAKEKEPGAVDMDEDVRERYGIKYVRGCEIVDFIGVDGNDNHLCILYNNSFV